MSFTGFRVFGSGLRVRERVPVLGFEVFTAVVKLDITSCSPLKVKRCLGEIYRIHLQDRRISQAKNSVEILLATCFHAGFLLGFFFGPD
jgi:hypothetical protein